MPYYVRLDLSDVKRTAYATIRALKQAGLDCCMVGSLGCAIYGMTRAPNDIDVVVLTNIWTSEELKRKVIAHDSNFYTVASKNPFATYRVLWYRLGYRHSCKVDLLVPGTMNIPSVPIDQIVYRSTDPSIPLMPFFPLLLLKLQAWEDHGNSHHTYMQDKQPVDVRDITELLNLSVTRYRLRLKDEARWLPETFIKEGKRRVKAYTRLYPTTVDQWAAMGFSVTKAENPRAAAERSTRAVRVGKLYV